MDAIELISNLVNIDDNLIQGVEELNSAINHIVQLLEDSSNLYFSGSYATSAFISITACEEIAKANIGMYTDGIDPSNVKKRNMFLDHKMKHKLVALPTIPMGQRLNEAIGEKKLQELLKLAKNGNFVALRENALYFQRENNKFVTPKNKISKSKSRSLLLFAIEAFDDAIVGYTNHSLKISCHTDEMFNKVAKA